MNLQQKKTSLIAFEILLASFVFLFQELAFIRWISSQVRVLAYFPNLILLSAFLGLGLGCLLANKRMNLLLWPASILMIVMISAWMSRIIFTQNSSSEHLWLLYADLPRDALTIKSIILPIIIIFIFCTITFIPLGHIIARRLQVFKERSNPLTGYIYNLIGSILGVLAFTLIGLSGIFPLYWFAIFITMGSFFFTHSKRQMMVYILCAATILVVVKTSERALAYSPYYALSLQENHLGQFDVMANGSMHQRALDLKFDDKPKDPLALIVRAGFHFPYNLLKKKPDSVLVIRRKTLCWVIFMVLQHTVLRTQDSELGKLSFSECWVLRSVSGLLLLL